MIGIEINNNNVYNLVGKRKTISKVQKALKIKNPNAFFLRRTGSVGKGWDGMYDLIKDNKDNFTFRSGLLQMVYDKCKEFDKVKIIDNRVEWNVKPKLITQVGNLTLRPYQIEAIKNIIFNKVGDHDHYIGVEDAATNAGKTALMAGIYLAFKKKIPAIILLKDTVLFEQFKKELPDLLPGVKLGFIRGKKIEFGDVTVVMVQTLSSKAKEFKEHLAKFGICLIDEADQSGSKQYKNIINHLLGSKVRVGLSGTIYMSKLKKHEMKNLQLKEFLGEVVFKISKKEMVDLGFSTDVTIRLWKGNQEPGMKGYANEYHECITMNKKRNKKVTELVQRAIRFRRLPSLVLFQFHEHGIQLEKMFKKLIPNKVIRMAHGSTKDKMNYIKDFRDGKIDILIASNIMLRGKNAPLIKHILNAGGGDSQERVSQFMGRGERKSETKTKYHMDDLMDEGKYLKRHSNHRRLYYRKEGFKVIEMNR